VIDTLSHADFATVVSFSSTAKSATPTLVRANAAGRKVLKDWVDQLFASGSTVRCAVQGVVVATGGLCGAQRVATWRALCLVCVHVCVLC
jgi:hypothetical protein